MNLSRLHDMVVDFSQSVMPDWGMADTKQQIAARLRLLPEVLDKSITEIATAAGMSPSAWSNAINDENKNIIRWPAATELREIYGLTLDWIYCGDTPSIRDEKLRLKIRTIERQHRARRRSA